MDSSASTVVATATMHPSGNQFDVMPHQSLLESGLRAGISLPFGCANGSCGDCLARIRNGLVKKIKHHDYSIAEAHKLDGYCLLCSNTAISDVEIEVFEASSVSDIPAQHLQAKPLRLVPADNVSVATFKFVRGKALRFLPGQHVTLTLSESEKISLPIASCPCNAQALEFHLVNELLTNSAQNNLIKKISNLADKRQRLSITGPYGNFTLSTATHKPKIFIACGGDFSQLQSMLEHLMSSDLGAPVCLIWQASAETGHYRSNLCRSWHDAIDEFSFVPIDVGSDPLVALSSNWLGKLDQCEMYLGKHNSALIAKLVAHGADTAAIFFPGATNDEA